MLKLIIEDDEGRKTVVPFIRDEITIGRQEGNTIRLTERNVSRRHAKLVRESSRVLVLDLGSSNGIRVNGDRITGQVQVGDGDLVQIGDYDLAVQREEEQVSAPTLPLASAKLTRAPIDNALTVPALPTVSAPTVQLPEMQPPHERKTDVQAVRASAPDVRTQSTAVIRSDDIQENRRRTVETLDPAEAPKLLIINTEFAGRELKLLRTEQKIGRTDDNDFAVDHRSLSRSHCKVVREENGEWRVIDLQSANGLLVNGEAYAQSVLKSGDLIELGHLKMRFLSADTSDAAAQAMLLSDEPTGSVRGDANVRQQEASSEIDLAAVSSPWPKRLLFAGLLLSMVAAGAFWFFGKSEGDSRLTDDSLTEPVEKGPKGNDAKVLADCLSNGKALVESLEWAKARTVLEGCKLSTGIQPEAKSMIERIDAEKAMLQTYQEAKAAIAEGRLESAQASLEVLDGSVLLKSKTEALTARLQASLQERVGTKERPATAAKAAEGSTEAAALKEDNSAAREAADAAAKIDRAAAYAAQGKASREAGNLKAAVAAFKNCLKLNPEASPCLSGIALAYINLANTSSGPEYRKFACGYYRRYSEVIQPGPTRDKVLELIKEFESESKGDPDPCPIPKKAP